MPRALVGLFWLRFLGGSEEQLVEDAAERGSMLDVESVLGLFLVSLSVLEDEDQSP